VGGCTVGSANIFENLERRNPVSAAQLAVLTGDLAGSWRTTGLAAEVRTSAQDILGKVRNHSWGAGTLTIGCDGTDAPLIPLPGEQASTFRKKVSHANNALAYACRARDLAFTAAFRQGRAKNLYVLVWSNYRTVKATPPLLVTSWDELVRWNMRIVKEARSVLVTTGSRSRDEEHLRGIEAKLTACPELVYYRVLFGNPFTDLFKEHLLRLVDLRPSVGRTSGRRTLYIGRYTSQRQPEAFICANDTHALVAQPSCRCLGGYDTAIVHSTPEVVMGYAELVRQLYQASEPLESRALVEALEVSPHGLALVT